MARVEKRTFICSHTRNGAKPTPHEGIKSKLGHWMHPDEMDAQMDKDYAGCMAGMYIHVCLYSVACELCVCACVQTTMRLMVYSGAPIFQTRIKYNCPHFKESKLEGFLCV